MTELLLIRAGMKDMLAGLTKAAENVQDIRTKREIGDVAYTVTRAYDALTAVLKSAVNATTSRYDDEEDDAQDTVYEDDILVFDGELSSEEDEDMQALEDF